MAGIDWSATLDLDRARRNLRTEFHGDWHVDPWGWPELDYIIDKDTRLLVERLNGDGARSPALIKVPKENWGTRPAVVLDLVDRLLYQALVDRASVDFIGSMSPSVYGWRLLPDNPERGVYSHNNVQWSAYRKHLAQGGTWFETALVTDLVSCFANISVDAACARIEDKTPKAKTVSRLVSFLDGFSKVADRTGLPQRSFASAAIANMMLEPLDAVLEHHSRGIPSLEMVFSKAEAKSASKPKRSWLRWMDDMWLFGDSASEMRRAQTELYDAAATIGAHINDGKTKVLEGEDVYEQALEIEHSAIDNALKAKNDSKPLEELVDRLLDDPDSSGRTSLKFAITRMRRAKSSYRAKEFAALATRMPHAADVLAPYFAESFTSGSLQDWFLDYANGEWAVFDWSVAQYLRMFDARVSPSSKMVEYVSEVLDKSDARLPLIAASSARLSAWKPSEARAVGRAALGKTENAHSRRAIALAALNAGEASTQVRAWLRQSDDNRATLEMLSYRSFAPPKMVD